MSSQPWYKRYPSNFISGTLGLTLEEKGAYSLVLDLIYDRGRPIPDDARYIAGVCGCSVRKWNAIRDRLVELGKIVVSDGLISNNRAEKEIEKAAKSSEERSESGRKGGIKSAENRSKSNKNNELGQAEVKHTRINQKPDTRIEKETPNGVSKKKGCRLSEDWQPDEVFAIREGMTAYEIRREAEKFRNYWWSQPGQRGVKLDWQATWRNWVLKATEGRAPVDQQPRSLTAKQLFARM